MECHAHACRVRHSSSGRGGGRARLPMILFLGNPWRRVLSCRQELPRKTFMRLWSICIEGQHVDGADGCFRDDAIGAQRWKPLCRISNHWWPPPPTSQNITATGDCWNIDAAELHPSSTGFSDSCAWSKQARRRWTGASLK